MRPVTIVTLARNRWDLTRTLLESLRSHTDLTNVEVLVVDDGSTDETPRELAKLPWLRVLRSDESLGFVRGVSLALRAIDPARDVVLLNADVVILHDMWIERLQETAHASARNGIVGCRLITGDGRLLHAGAFLRADDCRQQLIGSLELDLDQFVDTRVVEGIVFACAYLKREMLDDVGLLSDDLVPFFEETEYCLRAAERGWATLCCGSVTMRRDGRESLADDDAQRGQHVESSRATFRARWGARLDARYKTALTWQSTMNFPNGYSMSTREIVRALDEAGVRVDYSYAYGPGTPRPHHEPPATNDPLLALIRERRPPRRPDVAVTYAQGDVFRRNPGRRRIGFTMLEVDGFPAEWVRQANELDEIWTPTAFNRDGLLASGVTRPVSVVPLGIDRDHFHPAIRRIPNPRGEYVFVTNFEWGARKNPELLLRTFNRTFRRNEPVLLVCKINHRDAGIHVPDAIRSLGLDGSGGRLFFIYNRELPHYELASLYGSADCFVSTSRGEGWGMPLLEAMACGLPAIATDWGAHTAFLDPADTYPLRVRELIPAGSAWSLYEGFLWAEADAEHLSFLLRHVYEHRDEARERGLRAAARVRATLTWRHTAENILSRL